MRLRRILLFAAAAVIGSILLLGSSSGFAYGQSQSGRVNVSIYPPSLPEGSNEPVIVLVQLAAEDGSPILAPADTPVELVSSDQAAGQLEAESVVIPAGTAFVTATLDSGSRAGSTQVSASAGGYESGTADFEWKGTGPGQSLHVQITPLPPRIALGDRPVDAQLHVSVVDPSGAPAAFPAPTTLRIISSDESITASTGEIPIRAGQRSVLVPMSYGRTGEVTLTPFVDNLVPRAVSVLVDSPQPETARLEVHLSTGLYRLGAGDRVVASVTAASRSGSPGFIPCGQILLTSSNERVLSVPSSIEVPCGRAVSVVHAEASVGREAGIAALTAVAPGIGPGSADLEVVGRSPARLSAWVLPPNPALSDWREPRLVVQLLDDAGQPVFAQQRVSVRVNAGADSIDSLIAIGPGRSFGAADLPGLTGQIWVVSDGLTSTAVHLEQQELPLELSLDELEGYFRDGEQVTSRASVQSNGVAVPGVLLEWRSMKSGELLGATVTDSTGTATVQLSGLDPATHEVSVAADAPGYRSAARSTVFQVIGASEHLIPTDDALGVPLWTWAWLFGLVLASYLIWAVTPVRRTRLGTMFRNGTGQVAALWAGSRREPVRLRAADPSPVSGLGLTEMQGARLEAVMRSRALRHGESRESVMFGEALGILESDRDSAVSHGDIPLAIDMARKTIAAAAGLKAATIRSGGRGARSHDLTPYWIQFARILSLGGNQKSAALACEKARLAAKAARSSAKWDTTISALERSALGVAGETGANAAAG